jgi:co-chaperonin GroES (HSP10)
MIEALSTRLIIRQVKQATENTTTSGIILSGGSEDTTQAEIVNVGPNCQSAFAVGDRIVPSWQHVHHVRILGEDLFAIDEKDIVCRIKKQS